MALSVVGAAVKSPRTPPPAEHGATGWRRLGWRLYERLPRSADLPLRLMTRAMLPIANRHIPLTMLRGRVASGSVGRVLFAGAPDASPWVAGRFFAAEPDREQLGQVALRRLPNALAHRRNAVDLVVARVDRLAGALALDTSFVAVPEWVGTHAPVPVDAWELCRRQKSLAHNLSRMRRAGFRPAVSHAAADFETFYDRMYVPFIRRRHGHESIVTNRARLRRCFRQGGVMWVVRGEERVAGLLFRVRGRTLDLVVIGTADGALDALHDGAAFALDLFLFEHARSLGCTGVDFGGSRPSPRDGLLLYKARWNGRVVPNRTTFYDLRLGWDRFTPALLDFLARTPLIIRQSDGLAALGGPGTDTELRETRGVLRGLRRLYLLRPGDDTAPNDVTIPVIHVDPTAHPTWHPPFRPTAP